MHETPNPKSISFHIKIRKIGPKRVFDDKKENYDIPKFEIPPEKYI